MEDLEKDKIEPPEKVAPMSTPATEEAENSVTEHVAAVDECKQCVKLTEELEEQKSLVAKQKKNLEEMKVELDIANSRLQLHKGILGSYQPGIQELEQLRGDLKNTKIKAERIEEYATELEKNYTDLKKLQEKVFKEKDQEMLGGRVDSSNKRSEPDISHQQDRPISQNSGYGSLSSYSHNTGNRDYNTNNRNSYQNRNTGGDHRNTNAYGSGPRGNYNSGDNFNSNQAYNNNGPNANYQRERQNSEYHDGRGRYESGARSYRRQSIDNQKDVSTANQQQRSNSEYQQRERNNSGNRPHNQQGYNNYQGQNRNYSQNNRSDYNSRSNDGTTDGLHSYNSQKDTNNYNQNRSSSGNRGGNRGGFQGGERRESQGYGQSNYSDSDYQNRSTGRYDKDDRAAKTHSYNNSNYNNRDGNSYYQRNRQDSTNQGGNDGRQSFNNQKDNRNYSGQQNRSGNDFCYNKSIDVRYTSNREDRGGYNSEGDQTQRRRNTYENTGSLQRPKSSFNTEQGHHQGYQNANSGDYHKMANKDPLEEMIDHTFAEVESKPPQKSQKKFNFAKPGFGENSDDEVTMSQSKSSDFHATKGPSKNENDEHLW